jgi:uncharacterized C2H2 Zn-finger protein
MKGIQRSLLWKLTPTEIYKLQQQQQQQDAEKKQLKPKISLSQHLQVESKKDNTENAISLVNDSDSDLPLCVLLEKSKVCPVDELINVSSNDGYQCEKCSRIFHYEKYLKHIQECEVSDDRTSLSSKSNEDDENILPPAPKTCPHCSKQFHHRTLARNVFAHINSCDGTPPASDELPTVTCPHCSKVLHRNLGKSAISNHINSCGGDDAVPPLPAVEDTAEDSDSGTESFRTTAKYVCKKCHFSSNKLGHYEKHLLTKKHLADSSGNHSFECPKCLRYFTYEKSYKNHLIQCGMEAKAGSDGSSYSSNDGDGESDDDSEDDSVDGGDGSDDKLNTWADSCVTSSDKAVAAPQTLTDPPSTCPHCSKVFHPHTGKIWVSRHIESCKGAQVDSVKPRDDSSSSKPRDDSVKPRNDGGKPRDAPHSSLKCPRCLRVFVYEKAHKRHMKKCGVKGMASSSSENEGDDGSDDSDHPSNNHKFKLVPTTVVDPLTCSNCGKVYSTGALLWEHKKKCNALSRYFTHSLS